MLLLTFVQYTAKCLFTSWYFHLLLRFVYKKPFLTFVTFILDQTSTFNMLTKTWPEVCLHHIGLIKFWPDFLFSIQHVHKNMTCRCLHNRHLNKVWPDLGHTPLTTVHLKKNKKRKITLNVFFLDYNWQFDNQWLFYRCNILYVAYMTINKIYWFCKYPHCLVCNEKKNQILKLK